MIKPAGLLGLWGRQLGKTPGTLHTLSMSTLFISRHPFQGPVSVSPPRRTEDALPLHDARLPAGLQIRF